MADLILLAGGTGNQSAAVAYGGVIDRTVWDAGVPSDFVGLNGAYIVDDTGTLDYDGGEGGGEARLTGDFSSCVEGMYIYLEAIDKYPGYHKIVTINSTTSVDIEDTDLNGVALTGADDGETDYFCGGAQGVAASNTVIEAANDAIINYIDVASHSVEVLYNIDETSSTAHPTIDVGGKDLGFIRFTGTVYDNGDADACFQPFSDADAFLMDKADFPTITLDAPTRYFYVTGDHLRFKHIHITGESSTYVLRSYRGYDVTWEQCWIDQTNTGATYGQCIYAESATFLNCYISTVGTQVEECIYAIRPGLYSCVVKTPTKAVGFPGNTQFYISGNVFIGTGTSATIGIHSTNSTAPNSMFIESNIFYNFKVAWFSEVEAISNDNGVFFINNIIWGTNASGSLGLENDDVAVTEQQYYLRGNFIGNVENNDNFAILDNEWIELSANPFVELSPVNAEDFQFNDTAGGGALIKENKYPTNFDLDGTQDNYSTPCITAEPSGGGGGGGLNQGLQSIESGISI